MPNDSGVATAVEGDYGYLVKRRTDNSHILISLETGSDFRYKIKKYIDNSTSAKNLLDNSDFSNPINQNGNNSYAGHGYTIDRWKIITSSSYATLSLGTGCITLASTSSTGSATLRQRIAHDQLLGKKVTFCVKLKDGVLSIVSVTYPTSPNQSGAVHLGGNNETNFSNTIYSGPGYLEARIEAKPGKSINIEWAALYEGEYTSKTIPTYRSKGYAEEFQECRKYYRIYKGDYLALSGYVTSSATAIYANLPDVDPMRITSPTIKLLPNNSSELLGGIIIRGTSGYCTVASANNIYPDPEMAVTNGNGLFSLVITRNPGDSSKKWEGLTNNTLVSVSIKYNDLVLDADL